MENANLQFYTMPLDQRLDTIALLLARVKELAAWIEPDEKTALVLGIIMQHIQSAQTLATSFNLNASGELLRQQAGFRVAS